MQDPLKGFLVLLEYINEKLPGLGTVHKNVPGLPVFVKVSGTPIDTITQLIDPRCVEIQKEYDLHICTLGVDDKEVWDIYVDDALQGVRVGIDELTTARTLPVDVAVEMLREKVYYSIMTKPN